MRTLLDSRFWREEDGLSLTEGMLVIPIVMLVFAAFVEFGWAMSQMNQTAKALQFGARLAAVSNPLVPGLNPVAVVTPTSDTDIGAAFPPTTAGPWSCGPDTGVTCDLAEIRRLVYGNGSATSCQALGSDGVRQAMCHLNPSIQHTNVVVTYTLNGLGYWGRPDGAIMTIRLEVRDMFFNFPLLGSLLGISNSLPMAPLPVTVTSEDLSTTY